MPDTEGTVRFSRSGDAPTDIPQLVQAAVRDPANWFGRFVLVSKLGEGGMGTVWRAWQYDLGRWVALKFVKSDDPEDVARFMREAQLAAKLAHPNIIGIYEAGERDGRHFIAMEYVEGDDLLKRRVSAREAARLIQTAAEAVHHAHGQGVIHRDLKPQNLLLADSGRLFVTDFGLAKSSRAPSGLTMSGTIIGTPAYMSPEQARLQSTDARADVYGLGATLYDLVTGHAPFEGQDLFGLLSQVIAEEPVPPRRLVPRLDRDLETIILKALEKEPERRYPTAQAMAEDLARHLRGEPIEARPAGLARKLWLRVRRNPLASAALALLVILPTVLGTTWYFTRGTVNFFGLPPGARITIGGHEITEKNGVSLPAGGYVARFDAPNHEPEEREVIVERGRSKDVTVVLRRHRGRLTAQCDPSGSLIQVDNAQFGSLIPDLELDTGRYVVRAWGPGRFEQTRLVDIRRDQTHREDFWIDEGKLWGVESPSISAGLSGVCLLPGGERLLHSELTQIVLRSCIDGRQLWRSEEAFDPSHRLHLMDLGGSMGAVPIVISKHVEVTQVACFNPAGYFRWVWQQPAVEGSRRGGLFACRTDDRTGDGVADLAVAEREGRLWIIDGSSGETVAGPHAVPTDVINLEWDGARGAVVLSRTPEGTVLATGVRAEGGRPIWSAELGPEAQSSFQDVDGDGIPEVFWQVLGSWGLRDGATGAVEVEARIPTEANFAGRWTDLDGDGRMELIAWIQENRALAVRSSDGEPIWSRPVLWASRAPTTMGMQALRGPTGEVIAFTGESVQGLRPADGSKAWEVSGVAEGAVVADWDGDGTRELLVGMQGRGLLCVDGHGDTKWALNLDMSFIPFAALPDVDGDGTAEILIHSRATMIGALRGPRILWTRTAHAALQATPLVLDIDGDGSPEVFQLGRWPKDQYFMCLAGATGARRWSRLDNMVSIRPPAVADWNGDGTPELLITVGDTSGRERLLEVIRARDGVREAMFKVGSGSDYSTPAVADLTGDGKPDVVMQRWDRAVVAYDGATMAHLWTHATEGSNMGGLGVADLDADGRIDVVAPSLDGFVYGLRGRDGVVLWKTPIGRRGTRSPPALDDLTGDGTPEALVCTIDNGLCVIDGRTGELLWQVLAGKKPGETEGMGKPVVVRVDGIGPLIVASMGLAGAAAFDWEGRTVKWTSAPEEPVQAGAVVADLDGDGEREVIIGTVYGGMRVLDLRTGQRLWGIPTGNHLIEADPAVADLDGDGILDILIADHDKTLTAVNGRATIGARRAWAARQGF